jgi:probable HAF family extracellular repeat protein
MRTAPAALTLGACLVAAMTTVRGDGRSFRYSEIVVPGAVFSNAQGINAGGDIVGFSFDAAGKSHGFVWKQGEVATIDYPGAAGTQARGIGPGGDIVGTYSMPGEPAVNIHGYLLTTDGVFSQVDFPGHTNTIPQRILGNGTIVGCYHDWDTMETMRGILMRPGADNSETDAFASMQNGATPDARLLVGFYLDMMAGRLEGYVIEDGVFTPFVVPGSNLTAAWDVNPRGEIVGVFRDAANRTHGYVRDGNEYLAIDYPGATATRAFGINAGGDVVGAYVAGGVTRAFVASRTRDHR